MEIINKTILITGASTGIGKALGEKLLNFDCNLILTARRDEVIREWVNKIANPKAKVLILKNDVSDKKNVGQAYLESIREFGSIDIAILNSGISRTVNTEKFSSVDAAEVMNTNYLGVIYWIEQILPTMIERRSGIIAQVSSLVDNRGYSRSGFYCASKAALSIFSESFALDLIKYGVKILTIKPGFVETPMTGNNKFKMPFIISAEKSADFIISGIIKEKAIISFPLATSLGAKVIGMFPNWLYSKLGKSWSKPSYKD